MFEANRHRTSSAFGLRIAACAALLLLGLHGVSVAGHHHGADADRECELCHFGQVVAVAPEPPAASPVAPEAGLHIEEPAWISGSEVRSLPPSRGPPA
ncbi:MAG: hypothetical protein AAF481_12620 [Acidobacteriota bacterium]